MLVWKQLLSMLNTDKLKMFFFFAGLVNAFALLHTIWNLLAIKVEIKPLYWLAGWPLYWLAVVQNR